MGSEIDLRKETNIMYRKNAWESLPAEENQQMEQFAIAYRRFLDAGKTERECVTEAVRQAEEKGFVDLAKAVKEGCKIGKGDRLYCNWMGKSIMLFVIGEKPIDQGMNILGAHIDSPRVDVKQNPLYEDEGFGYLDTHYYGGIKKYQWVTTPMAIHGVMVKKSGEIVNVCIGEAADDPVFCFSDLLIHLSADQMSQTAAKVIEGEQLNLIIGSRPATGEEKDAIKTGLMRLLTEKYGVEEEDFISAELEIVPAGASRDLGLDRSMILGYGHDDRVCAYPSMAAVLHYDGVPERTLCAVLCDKEEIGSVGATGMNAYFFENTMAELMALAGEGGELALRRALANSLMLSSDVSAGFDPNYPSVFERKNTAFLGKGVCFNKYTGSRGKSGSNDANPEFISQLRRIMDDAGVAWQTAELGRVDAGGGGTIAYICAKYGMNVIDCGVAVLSMHAPWEVISKVDLWQEYKAYCAFLKEAGK